MAVHKAIRSNPQAQPAQRRPNHQLKSELFDTLHHLNRGYGISLAALHRLQKPGIFPVDCLTNHRNRTEVLRAQANRHLLSLFAGHEEQEAERLGRLCLPETLNRKRRP
jgi:hypothetical protein